MWDRFDEKARDQWVAEMNRDHYRLDEADVWLICARAALTTGREIVARRAQPDLQLEAVPEGWDDDALLAESMAIAAAG